MAALREQMKRPVGGGGVVWKMKYKWGDDGNLKEQNSKAEGFERVIEKEKKRKTETIRYIDKDRAQGRLIDEDFVTGGK